MEEEIREWIGELAETMYKTHGRVNAAIISKKLAIGLDIVRGHLDALGYVEHSTNRYIRKA